MTNVDVNSEEMTKLYSDMRRLFLLANRSNLRRNSDDYDQMERGVSIGSSYAVKIGDISFSFVFNRFDLRNIPVYVDGIFVLNFTGLFEWKQYSPALIQEISKAVATLLLRRQDEESARLFSDTKEQVEKDRKLASFQSKWGVKSLSDQEGGDTT